MNQSELQKIIDYVITQSVAAISNSTNEQGYKLDYLAIFSKDQNEYDEMISLVEALGQEVDQKTIKTGRTFLLKEPLMTSAGPLRLLKIRKPDPTRPQRGAPDFKVMDYDKFKDTYLGSSGTFTLMPRKDSEMIEIKGVDVLVYINNDPLGDKLNVNG